MAPKTVTQEFTVLVERRVGTPGKLDGPNRRFLYDGEFILYQERYARLRQSPEFEWSPWITVATVHEDCMEGIARGASVAHAVLIEMARARVLQRKERTS